MLVYLEDRKLERPVEVELYSSKHNVREAMLWMLQVTCAGGVRVCIMPQSRSRRAFTATTPRVGHINACVTPRVKNQPSKHGKRASFASRFPIRIISPML